MLVVPGQDEPREDLQPARRWAREVVLTRSRRRQGPSAVLPGHGRAHRAAKRPARTSSTSSATRTIPLAHETGTGPEIWRQMDGDIDAIVFGCGSSGTMTGLSRYFARVAPHDELVLADPVGSILAQYINEGTLSTKTRELDGRRHRRGFPAADLRLLAREEGLRDHRQGKLPDRARAAGEGRHPRRLVDRHAAGRGAEVLPRADRRRRRWSCSSATPATSTCRRCTTTTGCSTTASSSASSTATCAT